MTITHLTARDIRFPTSQGLDGSDAMNPDPDYSAACVVLIGNTRKYANIILKKEMIPVKT